MIHPSGLPPLQLPSERIEWVLLANRQTAEVEWIELLEDVHKALKKILGEGGSFASKS